MYALRLWVRTISSQPHLGFTRWIMKLLAFAALSAGLAGEAGAFSTQATPLSRSRAAAAAAGGGSSSRRHGTTQVRRRNALQMQNMGYPPLPDPFPPHRDGAIPLQQGEIAVRFIGTEDGEDKLVAAKPGD